MQNCPCGSSLAYASCCQPLHQAAGKHANTPEQLMRSRFSAFYLGNVDYLINTLHSTKRSPEDRDKIANALMDHKWHSLRVLNSSPVRDDRASVEFVAFCTTTQAPASPQQLHEHSRFVFEGQRWWYLDGDMLGDIKLGRNDPCWCGSGRKLKKCHSG